MLTKKWDSFGEYIKTPIIYHSINEITNLAIVQKASFDVVSPSLETAIRLAIKDAK
jgi:hypothetical protein